MSAPFKIDGPTCISFSGGRTSAYMLWCVLEAHGMTLRDYFAAKALQGFISRGVHYDADVDAARAYAFADAMLEARGE